MSSRPVRIPGPDHPISIEPSHERVVVTVAGRIIADTRASLVLREAAYPAVHYIPRADVDMAQLSATDHSTYCPYKGDCSYFSIKSGGDRSENAVWTYENPFQAVDTIRHYLAFYPDRVDSISIRSN